MSRSTRKYYISPGKANPLAGLGSGIPALSSVWDDPFSVSVHRCGMTWDNPGFTGFDNITIAASGVFNRHGSQRYSAVPAIQAVSDAFTVATPVDNLFGGSAVTGAPKLRGRKTLPTSSGTYPLVRGAVVARVITSSGSVRFEISDSVGLANGLLPTATLTGLGFAWRADHGGTIQVGDYLVVEIGIVGFVLNPGGDPDGTANDAPFTGVLDYGDSSATDLTNGDTAQHSSFGIINWFVPDVTPSATNTSRYRRIKSPTRRANRFVSVPDRTGDILNEFIL